MNGDTRLPVAVLISGTGSNLKALLEASAAGAAYRVVTVLSNRPEAGGLAHAAAAGVPATVIDHRRHPDRESFDRALVEALAPHAPQLVVLAGFMRVLTPLFVRRWAGRLLNIHPSLLPAWRGLDTHRRVLAAGERRHGASVHFVTEGLDEGPVIVQAEVPVEDGDDEARLAARVHTVEHRIYPLAVDWFGRGWLRQDGDRVWFRGRILDRPLRYPDDEAAWHAP